MKDPLSPWIPLRKDRGGEKQQSLSSVIEIQNVIKGGEKEELYLPSSPPLFLVSFCHVIPLSSSLPPPLLHLLAFASKRGGRGRYGTEGGGGGGGGGGRPFTAFSYREGTLPPPIQSAGERQRGKTQQPKRPPHVVVSKQDRRKRGGTIKRGEGRRRRWWERCFECCPCVRECVCSRCRFQLPLQAGWDVTTAAAVSEEKVSHGKKTVLVPFFWRKESFLKGKKESFFFSHAGSGLFLLPQ